MIQNKYVIRLTFVLLFITVIVSMCLYRYFMIEKIILEQAEYHSAYIAKQYKATILDKNQVAVDNLRTGNYQNLPVNIEFIKLAKESIEFFQNTDLNISLFDIHGNKLITNNKFIISDFEYPEEVSLYKLLLNKIDSYFLKNIINSYTIYSAFRGKSSSLILPRSQILKEDGQWRKSSFIRSYIPIIYQKQGNFIMNAVIAIDTDITGQWKNITYLEQRVFLTFIIVFAIFFSIILYNTNYAQRIIDKQLEANRTLNEARLRAEGESSAKTEFLANISHELRTPLNSIIGFSEIILSEIYGKLEHIQYKDYVNDIYNSGKHLLSVINDILDFSKVISNKLKVESIDLDLNKLASSSIRFVKPRADRAQIKIIEDFPADHIIIKADPKRLKQALLNILSNSVKFTPSGGSITLSIRKEEPEELVHIIIKDTGIGISEKDIPKALSTFGQVDNKLSRKYEGTGLGLPLTVKLVELMQGQFTLTSEVGGGTTITMTFKYSEED